MARIGDKEREGPHRGRGPSGWKPSDERIVETVSEALMEDRLLDARDIEVSVTDGVVNLTGQVSSYGDMALADMLARGCPGVKDVKTDLQALRNRKDPRAELGSRTSGYSGNVEDGEFDEEGRRQGPWATPSGSA